MAVQRLTDEVMPALVEWFDYNVAAGCEHKQLRQILIDSGYIDVEVDVFLQAQVTRRIGEADAPVVNADNAAAQLWQKLDVLSGFNQVSVGDRIARMLFKSPPHGVYYLGGFVSDAECDELVVAATPRLSPSRIVDEGAGADLASNTRLSEGVVVPRDGLDLVRRLEARVAQLTAIPATHGEGLQLLRYGVGGEYLPHFDFFEPETPGGARLIAAGGQRLASVIMYLTDVEAGGGTVFPHLDLEITPQRGAALLFPSVGRDGALLRKSLHAGLVVTSGQKWIATKWLRASPLR